jgi:uncharacterized membrane protein
MSQSALKYTRLLLARSLKDTGQSLRIRIVFSVVFGALITFFRSILSGANAQLAILSFLYTAVLASLAVFVGWFLIQMPFVIPYRLWKEDRDTVASLSRKVEELQRHLEPAFEICYENK